MNANTQKPFNCTTQRGRCSAVRFSAVISLYSRFPFSFPWRCRSRRERERERGKEAILLFKEGEPLLPSCSQSVDCRVHASFFAWKGNKNKTENWEANHLFSIITTQQKKERWECVHTNREEKRTRHTCTHTAHFFVLQRSESTLTIYGHSVRGLLLPLHRVPHSLRWSIRSCVLLERKRNSTTTAQSVSSLRIPCMKKMRGNALELLQTKTNMEINRANSNRPSSPPQSLAKFISLCCKSNTSFTGTPTSLSLSGLAGL